MHKPIDPRNNSLKEPQKYIVKSLKLESGEDFFTTFGSAYHLKIKDLIDQFEKFKIKLIYEGNKISPNNDHWLDTQNKTIYILVENPEYEKELKSYQDQILKYGFELKEYNDFVAAKKNNDIDGEIAGLKKRIEKLEAMKVKNK